MGDCCCDNYPDGPMPPFWGFSAFTPTIPKLYWGVKSQEQRILNLFDLLGKMICYAQALGAQVNIDTAEVEKLRQEFEELREGKFWDYYEAQIMQWVAENMPAIMAAAARQVVFGLTSDGYFCAYIPDAWRDIIFDTGMMYGRSDYGRLILRFDVDGAGVIDNTYSYSLANADARALGDIEVLAKGMAGVQKTLYTPLDKEV